MMQWELLVEDILQKNKDVGKSAQARKIKHTPLMEVATKPAGVTMGNECCEGQEDDVPLPRQRFALGGAHNHAYLTYREAQCMLLFMRGQTVSKVASYLKLSPRTVEFYLNNMKGKLNCRSKSELIELIIDTPFFQKLPQLERELHHFGVTLGGSMVAAGEA